MKQNIKRILIAKDGFPLETFENRPIINFIRRLLHGSHYECYYCYMHKQAVKNPELTQGILSTN